MEQARSSIVAGVAATVVLAVALFAVDLLVPGPGLFVFATVASLCEIGGPPYCSPDSGAAFALTFVAFVLLFVVAWPLFFAGFTWGLPGESGVSHGVVFGIILWSGYAVAIYGTDLGGDTFTGRTFVFAATFLCYVLYGATLGGTYDVLADHRTLLD